MNYGDMCDWVREIFEFQKAVNAEEKKQLEKAKRKQSSSKRR